MLDAASYLCSGVLLWRVSPDAPGISEPGHRQSFLSDLRDGFREVANRTWVWVLIVNFAVVNSLAGTWDVFGPVACLRDYGGAGAFGLLSAMWSVGAVVGGGVGLRFTPRYPLRVGTVLCLLVPIPTALVALRVPLAAIVPFSILAGVGPLAFNTYWWTALQQHVPAEAISRVMSFDFAGSYALSPIGQAFAGPLADGIGLGPAMLGCAAAIVVVVSSAFVVKDVWMLRSGSPAPVEPSSA